MLKQVTTQENVRFHYFMKSQDFLWSVYDICIYIKKMNNKIFNLIILLLYMYNIRILL